MNDDWDDEEYYIRNAIEGSAKLRNAILRLAKAPIEIVWVEPEGHYAPPCNRTIAQVRGEVADYFKISLDDMAQPSRYHSIAHPRQVAMYLAREVLGASFPKIGREFGNRDHTTAIHACNAVRKRMARDPFYRAHVEAISRSLTEENSAEQSVKMQAERIAA